MDITILFTIIIFTLTLQTLGLITKYKIFLLFSIGGYIGLIVEFSSMTTGSPTALVITSIGLIIFNLWYATLGGNN